MAAMHADDASTPDYRTREHPMTREQGFSSDEIRPLQCSPCEPGRLSAGQTRLTPHVLRKVSKHIDEHLCDSLRVAVLAGCAGLSTSHFARSFRNSTGMTAAAYIVSQRLAKAKMLLASTNLPIAQIALNTGFADQSHLTRRLNQFEGITPRAFRESSAGNEF